MRLLGASTAAVVGGVAGLLWGASTFDGTAWATPEVRSCPAEMVRVADFCIDRWEISTRDKASGRPLSPYYPPAPRLLERVVRTWQIERSELGSAEARAMPLPDLPAWQRGGRFTASAVSRPGVVPQGYLSRDLAERVCARAEKRLCTAAEWSLACRSERGTRFPYGQRFDKDRCNVYRLYHPAAILHGSAAVGHTDPRLNLVLEGTRPLLELTGARPGCASRWSTDAVFDMVGNLDEWVSDVTPTFMGGFYARAATKGCDAQVSSHASSYYDYSTGTRCCRSLPVSP